MAAAFRLQLLCVLLATLLLAGCGRGGSDSAQSTVSSRPVTALTAKPHPRQDSGKARPAAGGSCQGQLGGFVASMDSLRRRLAVGLTYDQYVAEVRGIGSTYRKIQTDRVQVGCLSGVGTPAERAFNRYIEAANDWGECVSEAGCTSATVEPVLQRRWRIASRFLSAADDELNAAAP